MARAGPLCLLLDVRDWKVASAATTKPVKITVPGPLTIRDYRRCMVGQITRLRGAALADVLNVEIRRLAEAGCADPGRRATYNPARKVEDALDFGISEYLERCCFRWPAEG
ncbi:MAG: hypothetical protein R3C97_14630 [Geminicoccaceae bacterium]